MLKAVSEFYRGFFPSPASMAGSDSEGFWAFNSLSLFFLKLYPLSLDCFTPISGKMLVSMLVSFFLS
jgi:hypothetical protein